jgi:hypothetical protein
MMIPEAESLLSDEPRNFLIFSEKHSGGFMEMNGERARIIEKMFDAALKEKMNQLAGKYDNDLVLDLWTRLEKFGHLRSYFGRWRWKPSMTIMEALECLDRYCDVLETSLQDPRTSGIRMEAENEKKT